MAQEKRTLDQSRQDERGAALAAGICADILQARGELEEALRIRREEELPVYERLGDVRSRAVTLGKVADILQARGELEEALHMLREQVLPILEWLGAARDLLVGRTRLALLYLKPGPHADRDMAANLLRLARMSAESLRLPEAAQIQAIQRQHGLLPLEGPPQ